MVNREGDCPTITCSSPTFPISEIVVSLLLFPPEWFCNCDCATCNGYVKIVATALANAANRKNSNGLHVLALKFSYHINNFSYVTVCIAGLDTKNNDGTNPAHNAFTPPSLYISYKQ